MANNQIKTRIIHKHDTEANWILATNFIPKKGEIIVYDKDSTYDYERFKIGDGETYVSSLPFANDALKAEIQTLLNGKASTSSVTQLSNKVDGKVDKDGNKVLSTNDYTTTEKNKLAGIAAGAEVNQNAFSNVTVGSTTISADSKTDTLTFTAGSNISLTPDATNDKITIAATYSNATTSAAGLMSANDKTKLDAAINKLDGIASGAQVNQNAFSNITDGTTIIAADSTTDTLTLVAGSNISLALDATNDKVTISATNTTYTFATGDNNGQIKVTPSGGSAQNINVKGLGSAAYKDASGSWGISVTGSSASCTGNAATATALTTSAGSASNPIYFSSGKPVQVSNVWIGSATDATSRTFDIKRKNSSDASYGRLNIGMSSSASASFIEYLHYDTSGTEDQDNLLYISGSSFYPNANTTNLGTSSKKWGTVYATTFNGSGASLTSLNASNISSGTIAAARLPASGVTAGTYGPSAAVTGNNNTTMNVPEITVDSYGRVTSITNRVYTAKNTTYTIPTSLKNPNALTVVGGSTTCYTYDGSAAKTLTIKAGSNITVTGDTSGNITIANSYSYSLPTASSSTKGGVKIGSNITVSSGTISLTKANVVAALGYTPPTTDTTYSQGTTSTLGLIRFGYGALSSRPSSASAGTIYLATS